MVLITPITTKQRLLSLELSVDHFFHNLWVIEKSSNHQPQGVKPKNVHQSEYEDAKSEIISGRNIPQSPLKQLTELDIPAERLEWPFDPLLMTAPLDLPDHGKNARRHMA